MSLFRFAQDFDGLHALMADECLTQFWPSSLRQPGFEEPQTKQAHAERAKVMFETFFDDINVSRGGGAKRRGAEATPSCPSFD